MNGRVTSVRRHATRGVRPRHQGCRWREAVATRTAVATAAAAPWRARRHRARPRPATSRRPRPGCPARPTSRRRPRRESRLTATGRGVPSGSGGSRTTASRPAAGRAPYRTTNRSPWCRVGCMERPRTMARPSGSLQSLSGAPSRRAYLTAKVEMPPEAEPHLSRVRL